MKRKFHDPNNHVPEVTPEDSWGEAEIAETWDDAPQTLLPKKRAAEEKPSFREVKVEEEKGLEIGVRVIEKPEPRKDGAQPIRLEVQEHVPKLLTPDATPLPKVVPKQVMEKLAVDPESAQEEWVSGATEGENWGKERTGSVRWMWITGISLAVVLIAAVILLPKLRVKGERGSAYFSKIEVDDSDRTDAKPEVKDDLALREGVEDAAKKLAHDFVTAKKIEDVLPLIRDRARVEPLLRARWKPLSVPAKWQVPDESQWAMRKIEKREYGYLSGQLPDVTRFYFYFVSEGQRTVLDWEASTGFSETPFEDLSKRKGEGGITRGVISPGDLYTFSLPEADYQCFRISSQDGETSVWGYAKRGSKQAEDVTGLFVQGAIPREMFNEYPVTLRLEPSPKEALPNQWVITEMLHIDWISP